MRIIAMLFMILAPALGVSAETKIKVSDLNSGDVELVGELGHPLGTYHRIVAEFRMITAKGRVGTGGRILMKVLEIDGTKVTEPIWLGYFKSITLRPYKLPDGTDVFPRHPKTHTLEGRTITCTVYEDIIFLDKGRTKDRFTSKERSQQKGFEIPWFETALGIIEIYNAGEDSQQVGEGQSAPLPFDILPPVEPR